MMTALGREFQAAVTVQLTDCLPTSVHLNGTLRNDKNMIQYPQRACDETASQSYRTSLDIWDHLTSTTHLTLTPARGRYSIYLSRRDERL